VAASLTYLALRQHDAVGLALFDAGLTRFVRPSNHPAHWKAIIHELQGAAGPAKTSLRKVLDDLAERLKRRTLIVLISDLFDAPAEVSKGSSACGITTTRSSWPTSWTRPNWISPSRDPRCLPGWKAAGGCEPRPTPCGRGTCRKVRRFIDELRRTCRDLRLDYELYNTRDPLDVALSAYLAARSAGIR